MREASLTHPAATVYLGDCIDVLSEIPDASIDSIVTDPPYGLSNTDPSHVVEALTKWATGERAFVPTGRGFMGKSWDAFVPPPAVWDECMRVLKPGGHLLAFAGSRTFDLMTLSIRFAGFDIRDSIAWLYGSGFPKSLDVSKAIDKIGGVHPNWKPEAYDAAVTASGYTHADVDRHLGIKASSCYWARADHRACVPLYAHWTKARDFLGLDDTFAAVGDAADRPITGQATLPTRPGFAGETYGVPGSRVVDLTAAATSNAEKWQGWGTALKPAFEPIVVARKPLTSTVAANVLAHGTGALNIDATRVGDEVRHNPSAGNASVVGLGTEGTMTGGETEGRTATGRWPANVLLDGSQADALDEQSGTTRSVAGRKQTSKRAATQGATHGGTSGGYNYATRDAEVGYTDEGGASRFFPTFRYQAKAPTRERPSYFRPTCDCENAWPTPTTSLPRATDETTAPVASSTSRSGSGSTVDPSPTGTTSTISTTTSSTTTPPTSSPSLRPITSGSTPDANSETESGGSPAASVESSSPSESLTGTSAARGGRSTDGAAPATSPAWSQTDVCGVCGAATRRESHATVKPLALMRWLVRLVTPPGGTVLDPFVGSGTTVEAALQEGLTSIGIEGEADYLPLIKVRLDRNPTDAGE